MMRKFSGEKSGFTYIELMIAVSIMALTLAFSGPALERYAARNKTKAAAREIYTLLQKARILAIKEDATISADFTEAGAGGCPAGQVKISYPDGKIDLLDLSGRTGFRDVYIRRNKRTIDVKFYANGTATPQTIEVRHQKDGSAGYDVIVNGSGGIRMGKETS